jgi:predicted molibdopterin-dependent oxidoreductase YjgC
VNVSTICPFCGCGCGLLLEVEKGRVRAAFPQRSHPTSRGTLCIKGWNSHQFIHHPQRLQHPLIKEKGVWKEVSWSKALTFAGDGLKRVQDRFGRQAVGVIGSVKCTNEEQYWLSKFSRTVLQTPHLDTASRLYHHPTVRGLLPIWGYGAATASLPDLEQAEAILVVGANPKTQSARAGALILQAAKRGRQVIVIDPQEQEHTRFYTQHLKLKPQTDLVLLNAFLNILRQKTGRSLIPISEHLKESLAIYTPEYAGTITGLTATEIVAAAELFGAAKTGMMVYGNGLTQQADSVANVHALWNLALLTGNLNKRGCGILPLLNSNNMQGSIDMGMATELLPGHAFLTDQAAADHWARFWKCTMPEEPGLSYGAMLERSGEEIHALYIVGENLARNVAEASALHKLDFLIVQELFMTETARAAQVVFPACSFAEKEGSVTNMERRVQRLRQAITPLGDSKPDTEIISLLSEKLGKDLTVCNPQQIFTEIRTGLSLYADMSDQALAAPGGRIWPADRSGTTWSFAPVEKPAAAMETPDTEFPMTLVVGRGALPLLTGTLIERSFTLDKEEPVGIVKVNVEDARTLKLRSGWNVKIVTPYGKVVRQVHVTRAVSPGILYAPIHHKNGSTLALLGPPVGGRKSCRARLEVE